LRIRVYAEFRITSSRDTPAMAADGAGASAMVAAAGGKVNRHAHVLLQQEQQRVKTLTD
jgi:hypothetical protein